MLANDVGDGANNDNDEEDKDDQGMNKTTK